MGLHLERNKLFKLFISFGRWMLFMQIKNPMKAICLISRAFREVAALEIWSKRNGGERKLAVCLLLSALEYSRSRWLDQTGLNDWN